MVALLSDSVECDLGANWSASVVLITAGAVYCCLTVLSVTSASWSASVVPTTAGAVYAMHAAVYSVL